MCDHVRDRIKSGESLVHLVSCLFDASEEVSNYEKDDPFSIALSQNPAEA